MLGFLSLFINWPMLLLVGALVVIGAILWFTVGPAKLLKVALDGRTWLVIIIAAGAIALTHSEKTIQKQAAQIKTQAIIETASKDTMAVVTDNVAKKEKRTTQQRTEQSVINAAPEGDKVDAEMDAIADENGDSAVTPK